jgi:hypothetical protein
LFHDLLNHVPEKAVMTEYCSNMLRFLLISLALVSLGCSNQTTGPDTNNENFVVTGTLRVADGESLPASPRLLVVWQVSSGSPDYEYSFGEGSIDVPTMTYRIEVPHEIPDVACNRRGDTTMRAGVGYIILFNDPDGSLKSGMVIGDDPLPDLAGAVSKILIVYRQGNDAACREYRSWLPDFTTGFSLGMGADGGPNKKDILVPVSSDTKPELLISSDPEDFEFPNWT